MVQHVHGAPANQGVAPSRTVQTLLDKAIENRLQLVRVASAASYGSQIAEDAYQSTVEQLLSQPSLNQGVHNRGAWLRTVVRNRTIRELRTHQRELALPEAVVDGLEHSSYNEVQERVLERDLRRYQLQSFAALKPAERQALAEKASGLTRIEIGDRHGWTQTKVNRLLTEGRQQLRRNPA